MTFLIDSWDDVWQREGESDVFVCLTDPDEYSPRTRDWIESHYGVVREFAEVKP